MKIKEFLDGLMIKPGDTVVDLGTGTGLLIPYIFAYQPGKVIAADLSSKMLEKVGERHSARWGERLGLLQTDVHALDMEDRSVDVMVAPKPIRKRIDESLEKLLAMLRSGEMGPVFGLAR